MSRIPQPFIDDLLSRVDIVSIIDSRVKLKRSGKNYAACCPFHEEKTPSFTVSPDKQFYYCFGCGATGNAIGFVMEYERSTFVEAIEGLAKNAGLEVPRENSDNALKHDNRRKKLFQVLEEANEYYQNQLREHSQRRLPVSYLQNRGLTGQIAKDFGLGFAPPGRNNLLLALNKDQKKTSLLVDAGLAIEKPEESKLYDRFRHRITFPIRDERGRVIGFGGRVLGDEKPKYLNSPETEVFHKSRELYGLYEARKSIRKLENLLVVEGYMDVIALAQYGISNAVATLGTACGEEHLKLAFRHASEIVFCFDGDEAGRRAAKRALTNSLTSMEDGRQIKFLFLPEGQDPDSLVRQIGTERFLQQVSQSIPLEEFLFDVAADGINISTMEGRAKFSKAASPMIGELPEGIFKELMLENLAQRTGLDRELLSTLQQEPAPAETSKQEDTPRPTETHETTQHSVQQEHNTRDNHTAEPVFTRKPTTSAVTLTPAKIATLILLERPELLQQLEQLPEQAAIGDDHDNQRLSDIINYLRKRPNSSFNNILGFWGGAKGVKEQQQLAQLMANQLLSATKTITTYNPLQELQDAILHLNEALNQQTRQQELNSLKMRGLENLSNEEKLRFIELTRD